MDCAVQRGAQEIVHSGIHDNKAFAAVGFYVLDASEENAGVGDDRAARFEQKMDTQRLDRARNHTSVVNPGRRLLIGVAHAEAAAKIEIFQIDSQFAKFANERDKTRERLLKLAKSSDLRANVRAETAPPNPPGIAVLNVELARGRPIETKFVLVVAGGDVRVAAGLDVGIDADGDTGSSAAALHLIG